MWSASPFREGGDMSAHPLTSALSMCYHLASVFEDAYEMDDGLGLNTCERLSCFTGERGSQSKPIRLP